MNFYKKFNTYLLENYPLVWHSKVIQLTFAGILVWLISYLIGYQTVDLNVLNNEYLEKLYFDYYFIFFHIITIVIILTIWAIYFYKNNAFKSYYPLEKAYFTKLFFYLFIPFTLIISAYFPYTMGAKSKATTFFNEKELKNDINKINLGYTFLVHSPTDYDLENRAFPKPYPLNRKDFNYSSKKWDITNLEIHDSQENEKSLIEYKPDNYKQFIVNVDGLNAQFYKSHEEYIDSKKCNTSEIVYQLIKEENLDNPSRNSILNFSTVLINPSSDELSLENYYYEENASSYDDKTYIAYYAPIVHEWVKGKRYNAIQNCIEQFEEVCEKYKIDHKINAKHMVRFLKYKNFKNFHKSITKSYEDTYSYFNMEDEMNQIESVLKRKNETIKFMASQHVYFYDENGLTNVFNNFKNVNNSLYIGESLIIFLFISLSITWLFVCFEFTSIKSFIISVPIAGVIAIINSLIITFSSNRGYGEQLFSFILSTFIITFCIIVALTIIGLKTKTIKKGLLNILMNLTYFIAPIFLLLIILLYNQSTKYVQYIDRCKGIMYRTQNSMFLNSYWLFLSSLIGILLFFSLLKKWKAYEE